MDCEKCDKKVGCEIRPKVVSWIEEEAVTCPSEDPIPSPKERNPPKMKNAFVIGKKSC